jgi:chaperonin GroES
MQIRPMQGQVLVRLMPPDYWNPVGLHIPESAQLAPRGEKAYPRKASVVAIGPWRKTKQGYAVLPDFHPGQTVICNEYLGTKLTRNIGEQYRLCRIDDVLAVCEETQPALG